MRALFVFLVTAAAAQTPADRFPITGMVVNSEGGAPVKRALVNAMCFPAVVRNAEGRVEPREMARPSAVSDDSGMFRLDGVPAGRCMVSAQKPGFTHSEEWEGITISGPVTDAKVTLAPLGTLAGKVIDQDGAPVYGATILVITSRVESGLRVSHLSRTVRTDDRGIYRVWNLTPGKYYVKAAGKRAVSNLYASDSAPVGVFPDSFPPTYFGGAVTLATATPVVIGKGTFSEADIKVSWRPAFQVSGTIENFTPRQPVEFELSIDGEEFAPSSVNVHGDTGRFEILDVLPGTYLLRARQKDNWAERSITVRGDLKGVTVRLAPPVGIPVVERVANPNSDTDAAREARRRGLATPRCCSAALWQIGYPPSDASVVVQRQAMNHPDSSPVIDAVPTGTYRVVFDCWSGYVQSATWGTQDLLANPMMVVAPGTPPAPIEIVAHTGGGRVTVQLPAATGEQGAQVLSVPQFTPSAGPTLITAQEETAAVVAPGAYIAYAFHRDAEVEYRNPEFLRSVRGGVAFQVTDGGETKVTLTEVVQ